MSLHISRTLSRQSLPLPKVERRLFSREKARQVCVTLPALPALVDVWAQCTGMLSVCEPRADSCSDEKRV